MSPRTWILDIQSLIKVRVFFPARKIRAPVSFPEKDGEYRDRKAASELTFQESATIHCICSSRVFHSCDLMDDFEDRPCSYDEV